MTRTTENVKFDEALNKLGYKMVHRGCWESSDLKTRVFSTGDDPTNEWKVYRHNGKSFQPVPGGGGVGSVALLQFFNNSL